MSDAVVRPYGRDQGGGPIAEQGPLGYPLLPGMRISIVAL
jgi:hypothetical protein